MSSGDIKKYEVETPSVTIEGGATVMATTAHGVPDSYDIVGFQIYALDSRAYITAPMFYTSNVSVFVYNPDTANYTTNFRITMLAKRR